MGSVICTIKFDSPDQNTHLEFVGIFSKFFKPRHGRRNVLEVSFHLLAEAHVETGNVREARNAEIKVKNMKPVAREDFTKKGSLAWVTTKQCEALRIEDEAIRLTLPTALAPKSTVKEGSASRARSMTRNSTSRGKKLGRRVIACLMRSRGT